MDLGVRRSESFPFAKYDLIESVDPNELQSAVSNEIAQHRFSYLDKIDTSRSRITCVRLRSMVLFGVRFGSTLHASTAPINALQLVVPLTGKIVRNERGIQRIARPTEGFLLAPQQPVDLVWQSDCDAVVVWVDQHVLNDRVLALFGQHCSGDMAFPSRIKLNNGVGLSIANSLTTMVNELDDESSLFSKGVISKSIEEILVTSMLYTSSTIGSLHGDYKPYGKSSLSRAMEFIHEHIEDEIAGSDLVEATGVSLRKLQYDFSKHFNMGPMSKIRQEKLLRARQLLKESDPKETTVADIAARWGFFDRRYFTKVYKSEFGEWPSKTLNRPYFNTG